MVHRNEVCHLSRHLETGMTGWGNDFEGCSEQACQQVGEAGGLEEEDLWDRLPSGAAEREVSRQLR